VFHVRSLVLLTCITMASAASFPFQMDQQPQIPSPSPFPPPTPAPDENRVRLEKDMAKKANHARQEDIRRDTDQLLKLATELKDAVDRSNENMLSLDVIRKADEVEKLAHSVKDKMRAGY
jgi:hypothetical protein